MSILVPLEFLSLDLHNDVCFTDNGVAIHCKSMVKILIIKTLTCIYNDRKLHCQYYVYHCIYSIMKILMTQKLTLKDIGI